VVGPDAAAGEADTVPATTPTNVRTTRYDRAFRAARDTPIPPFAPTTPASDADRCAPLPRRRVWVITISEAEQGSSLTGRDVCAVYGALAPFCARDPVRQYGPRPSGRHPCALPVRFRSRDVPARSVARWPQSGSARRSA